MDVAVLGAGDRGQGVARRCFAAAHDVTLHGDDANVVMDCIDQIQRAAGTDAGAGSLEGTTDLEAGVGGTDVVVEATGDDLSDRRALVARLEAFVGEETLIATSDPDTAVSAVAAGLRNPARAVGLYFLDGADVAEVVAADQTASEALERAVSFVETAGCVPLVARDAPGFVVTRLDMALVAEAARLVEAEVASVPDIDRALERGRGHDAGPLALADRLGLDRVVAALEQLSRRLGERFDPPELLTRKVDSGHLGVKTGTGFYHWEGGQRGDPADPNPSVSVRDEVETDPTDR